MALLEVEGVSVQFGGARALSGVSLQVEAGTVTGLVGPNGAGKTTLFNVITGLDRRPPMGGCSSTRRNWATCHRRSGPARAWRARFSGSSSSVCSRCARTWRWPPTSAGAGTAASAGGGRRVSSRRPRWRARLLEQIGLAELADTRADRSSTGSARLVELGRALATEPRLLLLDEPASGQDDVETERFAQLIQRLAADGMGVLIVEHDMDLVMRLCSLIYVLDFGRLLLVRATRGHPERRGGATGPTSAERRCDRAGSARRRRAPRPRVAGHPHRLRPDRGAPRGGPGGAQRPRGCAARPQRGREVHHARAWPLGLHRPITGDVLIGGEPVNRRKAEYLVRQGICTIPEGRGVFPSLTVRRTSACPPSPGPRCPRSRPSPIPGFPMLKERRNQPAGTLSGGEQHMLSMARALTAQPTLLLLDELSMGLASIIVDQLYEIVANLAAKGCRSWSSSSSSTPCWPSPTRRPSWPRGASWPPVAPRRSETPWPRPTWAGASALDRPAPFRPAGLGDPPGRDHPPRPRPP